MNQKRQRKLLLAFLCLVAFVLWTTLLPLVDTKPIGPRGSSVGFATFNGFVHGLTGVCMPLYLVTDWLGLVPIAVAFGFAVLGLVQWIRRRRLLAVDRSILVLGGFYLATLAVYVLFELLVINCRPVLIDGFLEASYPSSTTVLTLCIMPTAGMQFAARIRKKALRCCVTATVAAFTVFMVLGRFLSGVHWASDIIGGFLVSAGLVGLYDALVKE